MAGRGVLGCVMGVPDACSFCLGKRLGAFALGCGYLHVYVEREINGKVRTKSFVLGKVVSVLASSVLCFGLSYRDEAKFYLINLFTCWFVNVGDWVAGYWLRGR